MGTINKGILGGFSGKVGTVIGGTWKGIDYMRSKSNKRSFVPSQKQLEQQAKFALMMRFLQPLTALLRITFNNFAVKQTGMNSAFSYNIENAVAGTYPNYTIAYANVLVGRGDLPNVLGPAVTSGAGSVLTFSWTDNSGVGNAQPTDEALFVAYCPDLKQSIFAGGATRSAVTGDLNLLSFAGKVVETYITFVSEDLKSASTSIFTGEVTVS